MAAIITLTTDFGIEDWFVGAMKGVMLGIQPKAQIIDLTHSIAAGNVAAAAFALASSFHFFPKKTVHVCIVDPGVGSGRKAIAVQTNRYFFVGPDNGVLGLALEKEKMIAAHRLENEDYFRHPVSRTFHGRDVFAPVAAHVSRGIALSALGPRVEDYIKLEWPAPRVSQSGIEGQVVYIDHFGNAITNISEDLIRKTANRSPPVLLAGKRRVQWGGFYQQAASGAAVAVAGSSGWIEIAINGGNAARVLNLQTGSSVRVILKNNLEGGTGIRGPIAPREPAPGD